ncbi:MAG: ribosome small subunit-dependent GTPase A [Oscillospiraceae bacterium]|nr:ribosome small subunit-dependent GTPase A [Oscillospiraceae bacterium]
MTKTTGKIIKSVGGFFHTETPDGVFLSAARGLFRLQKISPCVGDEVEIEVRDDTPIITRVLPRKNYIIRPPLANLDAAIIVISTVEPAPNMLILDKLIAIFESKDIEPVPLFTKIDKKSEARLREIYEKAGFTVFSVDNSSGAGATPILEFLRGKTCALIGNTGVGKSSTLNSLFPALHLETAEISKKLGRGKHTTRQVELYKIADGDGIFAPSYIADTPGFSTVEAAKYGKLDSSEVALNFREFLPFVEHCKFSGCRHVKEDGCAVLAAKERGEITESRFDSYVRIFEDAWTGERTYK